MLRYVAVPISLLLTNMHNATRRFRRPLSYTRPPYRSSDASEDDLPTSPVYQNRQVSEPDALRGAMLVALIVVTIVLYILLWELERSSFTPVSNSNTSQSVVVTSPSSINLESTSTQYPQAVVSPLGNEFNLFDGQIALHSSRPSRMSSNVWPPPITRLPEEHDTGEHAKKEDDHARQSDNPESSSFEANYCSGPCRFLLPVRIGEQESKARLHLGQLLILARRLNRTIVLPNVGKSRMSACSKWQFGAYYDTNGLVHKRDTLDSRLAVDLEEFAKWVDKRLAPPSSFVVSMESIPRNRRDVDVVGSQTEPEGAPFIIDNTEADPKILSCLESRFPRLGSSLSETILSISFNAHKIEPGASTHLVHLLSNKPDIMDTNANFDLMTGPGYDHTSRYSNFSYPSLADIDVLILDYDLRHPLFSESPRPNFNLHYAPMLYNLADRLSDNVGPFLGVHWRMENVPVQNLAWCAASLVNTLHALLQDEAMGKHIRHVWLATDYPRPLSTIVDRLRFLPVARQMSIGGDGKPLHDYAPLERSSTFKALTSEHDNAIGMLAEAFQPGGDLDTWELTDLAEQLRRHPYVEGRFELNETLLSDPGVFGILDKLVIVQAKAFVSGSTDCGKTRFAELFLTVNLRLTRRLALFQNKSSRGVKTCSKHGEGKALSAMLSNISVDGSVTSTTYQPRVYM